MRIYSILINSGCDIFYYFLICTYTEEAIQFKKFLNFLKQFIVERERLYKFEIIIFFCYFWVEFKENANK